MVLNRRRMSVLVFTVAALGVVYIGDPARGQGASESEREPNNSPQTANVLGLTSTTLQAAIDKAGDVDFFQTVLTEGNVVRVQLGGVTGEFDARIRILSSDLPQACDGGANDGMSCSDTLDCPAECINSTCVGGPKDGDPCFAAVVCGTVECGFVPIQNVPTDLFSIFLLGYPDQFIKKQLAYLHSSFILGHYQVVQVD